MNHRPSAKQAFDQIVGDLHGTGRIRVWSIIVSAFGDLLRQGHPEIPAAALQSILDPLKIGPGAVRTAVSRLAKDGWIERTRSGRNTSYRLTAAAGPEFDVASRTIYATTRPIPRTPPSLLIVPEGSEPRSDPHLIMLRRGVFLWTGAGPPPDDICVDGFATGLEDAQTLPGWARASIAPVGLNLAMQALVRQFTPLADALRSGDQLDPVCAVAARIALIHAWRRVALKHPFVSDALLPDGWAEKACRDFVQRLHAALSPKAALWQTEYLDTSDA